MNEQIPAGQVSLLTAVYNWYNSCLDSLEIATAGRICRSEYYWETLWEQYSRN